MLFRVDAGRMRRESKRKKAGDEECERGKIAEFIRKRNLQKENMFSQRREKKIFATYF